MKKPHQGELGVGKRAATRAALVWWGLGARLVAEGFDLCLELGDFPVGGV